MYMKSKKILYISYKTNIIATAQSINAKRRKIAMNLAGYDVIEFIHSTDRGIADFFSLMPILSTVDIVCIRIDGSGILDKFTLLKCFYWNIKILWEIHGFPQENNLPLQARDHLKRWLFSCLTDGYIYISSELKRFASDKIAHKKSEVISNFVLPQEITHLPKSRPSSIERYMAQPTFYKVAWAGNTMLDWQATDTIEKTAQYIYAKDPSIIFLVIGGNNGKPSFKWHKNIMVIGRLPREKTLQLISVADVCIALYHKPAHVPFYFVPLKILDYMVLKKPIIATKFSTIQSLLRHQYSGILTDNTVSDIAKNILLLKKDKLLATTLGEHAFDSVRLHHTIKQALPLYQKLLSTLSK